MASSSGSSAQAVADALLIDAGTNVAFAIVPGAVIGAMDVGTTPDRRLWFRAVLAVQFARGFMVEDHARTLLPKTVQEDDGVPDGFQRGRWKVGDARREGDSGWSVSSRPCVTLSRPKCIDGSRLQISDRRLAPLQTNNCLQVQNVLTLSGRSAVPAFLTC